MVAGAISSMAVTREKKELYAWGGNQNGQLGIGNTSVEESTDVPTPHYVMSGVSAVVCGDSNCVVMQKSELQEEKCYAWGRAYQIEESLSQQNTIEDVAIFDPMELADGV